MTQFERMFCGSCKRYTNHERTEFKFECIHCMTEERSAEISFQNEVQVFRMQMAKLDKVSDVLAFYKVCSDRLKDLIEVETCELKQFTSQLMKHIEGGEDNAA